MNGRPTSAHSLAALAMDYANALVSLDAHPAQALRVIATALEQGISARDLYLEVVPAALHEVGRRWQRGQLSVAAEHLATYAAQDALRTLVARLPRKPPHGRSVVVAAVEGERHALGARIVADLLDTDGWQVFFVGAATPSDALGRIVQERRPAAVVLSVTLQEHLSALAEAVAKVRRIEPAPFVAVGGQACTGRPGLAAQVGADVCLLDPDRLLRRLRDLLSDRHADRVYLERLSARERDVLALLAEGLTNAEIAQRLNLSLATAKSHVGHVLAKLQVRNRAEASALAARNELARGPMRTRPSR